MEVQNVDNLTQTPWIKVISKDKTKQDLSMDLLVPVGSHPILCVVNKVVKLQQPVTELVSSELTLKSLFWYEFDFILLRYVQSS